VIKVIAVNKFGDSEFSKEGSGAVIQTGPDAPINLRNVAEITDVTKIGMIWENGVSDGGASIIDYTIYYTATTTADFTELESGVLTTQYTTRITLVAG
jgi:hypothetical protein